MADGIDRDTGMAVVNEKGILELCKDLAALGEEHKRLRQEQAEYSKALDAWWAKIDATREARSAK